MIEFIPGNFKDLRDPWERIYKASDTRLLFSSPGWSELWWKHFGAGSELHLGEVRENGSVIGIAPLRVKEGILYFIGSDNVCDFLDFPVESGKENLFFNTLLDHLTALEISSMELTPVLPDSNVKRFLEARAQDRGLTVSCSPEDVTLAMDLPGDLSSYLSLLSGKQRHEILRKERRLNEEGEIVYRIMEEGSTNEIDTFLRFFRESREDKNKFLTDDMEVFFRDIIDMAAADKMLQLGILELNKVQAAVTLCFTYQNDMYLYNSGYNPAYRLLSIGLLSKYFCIKRSIESGKRRFDFLKGAEKYKFHLGGSETQLFRCIIKK
ncbi:MAG: GNAT family N-acetyltransferase [Dehalococcoidia bacterium]|jgi:CelD/BcsL family acetyltransferase involved in cellulose biosynthesis